MRGMFDLERPGVYQLLIGPTSAAISNDWCYHRAPDDLCAAWIHALLPPAAAFILAAIHQGVRVQMAAKAGLRHQDRTQLLLSKSPSRNSKKKVVNLRGGGQVEGKQNKFLVI